MRRQLAAFVVTSVIVFVVQGAPPEDHEIKSLPGLSAMPPFKQYSGYITVDESHGRNLFYWFVESQRDPANDPLLLWMNGGPGCSSLGGFFTELGPFRPNKNLTLSLNEYAWNNIANVIFLESPSGVGFSYSGDTSDYKTGDARTAADVVTFLVEFLKMYPSLARHELYISGESYGGHYVPTTARAILEHNAEFPQQPINLHGIMVGNPWTDPTNDNKGIVQTWFGYNLITDTTASSVYKYCNFTAMKPLKSDLLQTVFANVTPDPAKCDAALGDASKETGHLNPYNLYGGLCYASSARSARALMEKFAVSDVPLQRYAKRALQAVNAEDPCTEEYATSYLNQAAVQDAIHARRTKWSECNMAINGNYSNTDFVTSMLPVYKQIKDHLHILIYSGDVDAVCPTHGSRNWLNSLVADGSLTISSSWQPWQGADNQVGGYVTHYGDRFTFTTIHGAGHMVPGTQPSRAYDMLKRYLSGVF